MAESVSLEVCPTSLCLFTAILTNPLNCRFKPLKAGGRKKQTSPLLPSEKQEQLREPVFVSPPRLAQPLSLHTTPCPP